MPHYLVQFAYTPESWAAMIRKPEDRTAVVEALLKAAGGRLISLYYHAGEFDGIILAELPNDSAANAAALSAGASGGLKATRTTRLYTPKETVETLTLAGKLPFRSPGA
jgi:uncharacterized protein with GYD domain